MEMNFDPQKFFIGIMDFFSILLPGALLAYLLMGEVGLVVLGDSYHRLAGGEAWAAFLFASYLLGHLIFLLGSWLDEFYDWARRYTLNAQIVRLARRGRLLNWPARALIWLVFKRERNLAVDQAAKIRLQALGELHARESINTFQWCKALLNLESPASLAVVQRFEADSKFFRCFTVVLLLLLLTWPLHHHWPAEGIPVVFVLLLMALWRYMEQRLKSTNQAYWSVIAWTARDGKFIPDKPKSVARNRGYAGGVAFRIRHKRVEYLLVEAKKDPSQWVLPKGHIEESEHPTETAVREVNEEAGVWATIGTLLTQPRGLSEEDWLKKQAQSRLAADLGNISYSVDGDPVTVHYYLMQAVGRGLRKEKNRRHIWLPLERAVVRASHNETREMLKLADQRRSSVARSSSALRKLTIST